MSTLALFLSVSTKSVIRLCDFSMLIRNGKKEEVDYSLYRDEFIVEKVIGEYFNQFWVLSGFGHVHTFFIQPSANIHVNEEIFGEVTFLSKNYA